MGCLYLIDDNVSSISGVHYSDKAKLCNKYHITNRADWDYVVHAMIYGVIARFFTMYFDIHYS